VATPSVGRDEPRKHVATERPRLEGGIATLCLMQSSRHSIEPRLASELAVDLLEGCLERI